MCSILWLANAGAARTTIVAAITTATVTNEIMRLITHLLSLAIPGGLADERTSPRTTRDVRYATIVAAAC